MGGVSDSASRRQPARRRVHAGGRRARSDRGRARAPRRGRRSCAAPASRRRTPATCAPRSCWRCSARPRAELPLPLELVCARAAVDRAQQGHRPRPAARASAARARRRAARGADAGRATRAPWPTVSTRSPRRRTGGGCAPTSCSPSNASTRPSAQPSQRTPRAGRRAPPGSRARPTTACSRMPRRGCAATCAVASPGSVRSAASCSALARCSSTSRPCTAPRPRPPQRSPSPPRSCSACTTRAPTALRRRSPPSPPAGAWRRLRCRSPAQRPRRARSVADARAPPAPALPPAPSAPAAQAVAVAAAPASSACPYDPSSYDC